jgi:hypothetical protein
MVAQSKNVSCGRSKSVQIMQIGTTSYRLAHARQRDRAAGGV